MPATSSKARPMVWKSRFVEIMMMQLLHSRQGTSVIPSSGIQCCSNSVRSIKRALLDAASDGIDDFLRFRGVCTELLAAEEHFSLADGSIDWESYAQSLPTNTPRGELRYFLGWLAVNELCL